MATKKETAPEKKKRLKAGIKSFSTIGGKKKTTPKAKKTPSLRQIQAQLDAFKKRK